MVEGRKMTSSLIGLSVGRSHRTWSPARGFGLLKAVFAASVSVKTGDDLDLRDVCSRTDRKSSYVSLYFSRDFEGAVVLLKVLLFSNF